MKNVSEICVLALKSSVENIRKMQERHSMFRVAQCKKNMLLRSGDTREEY